MKVAIPEWQNRVSPVLDNARHLVIFDIDNQNIRQIQEITCDDTSILKRVERLRETGTQLLICGAVSHPLRMAIHHAGIELIAHTCGKVEDVARAYATGQLPADSFCMPGCHRQRRRHCQRHNTATNIPATSSPEIKRCNRSVSLRNRNDVTRASSSKNE